MSLAFEVVNVGQYINDTNADEIRTGFQKVNYNFALIAASGGTGVFSTKTITGATYTLLPTDGIVCFDATLAPITVTVPAAVDLVGKLFLVAKVDGTAHAVTFVRSGSNLIMGSTAMILDVAYDTAILVAFNTANYAVF